MHLYSSHDIDRVVEDVVEQPVGCFEHYHGLVLVVVHPLRFVLGDLPRQDL